MSPRARILPPAKPSIRDPAECRMQGQLLRIMKVELRCGCPFCFSHRMFGPFVSERAEDGTGTAPENAEIKNRDRLWTVPVLFLKDTYRLSSRRSIRAPRALSRPSMFL